jgi:hypothetical protein
MEKTELREWWVKQIGFAYVVYVSREPGSFRLVEYSAYEKVVKERDKALADLIECNEKVCLSCLATEERYMEQQTRSVKLVNALKDIGRYNKIVYENTEAACELMRCEDVARKVLDEYFKEINK